MNTHCKTRGQFLSCQVCPGLSATLGLPLNILTWLTQAPAQAPPPSPNPTGAEPPLPRGWRTGDTGRLTRSNSSASRARKRLPGTPGKHTGLHGRVGTPRNQHFAPGLKGGEALTREPLGHKHCSLLEKEGGDKCRERPAGHSDGWGWEACTWHTALEETVHTTGTSGVRKELRVTIMRMTEGDQEAGDLRGSGPKGGPGAWEGV